MDLKEIWPSHKLWGIIINYYKSVNNMFKSIWIISDNIIIIISSSLSMVDNIWQNYFRNSNVMQEKHAHKFRTFLGSYFQDTGHFLSYCNSEMWLTMAKWLKLMLMIIESFLQWKLILVKRVDVQTIMISDNDW